MTIPQTTTTVTLTVGPGANTEIDLADYLPEAMDVRGDNDPLVSVVHLVGSTDTMTDYTSVGQGATGDPGSGEVVVVSGTSIALGDSVSAGEQLSITYEAEGQGDRPT